MKPTQISELLANIRKSFVSFFSILMFVALGAGIFVGIIWSSPALERAVGSFFEQGNFHHVQITYPYGLTEDDLAQLAQVEGVSDVEAGRIAFAKYRHADADYTIKLQTLSQRIDVVTVVEGTLPSSDGELALKASRAQELGLSVGDTITLVHDASDDSDGDGMAQLTRDDFVVTALVESPEYVALSPSSYGYSTIGTGSIDAVAWVREGVFDDAAYHDGYTVANVRCNDMAALDSFSDEYNAASRTMTARISELADTLAPARYDELHQEAARQIADGEAQLQQAEQKIAEGEQAIAEGTQQLAEARMTLDSLVASGQAQLESAYQQLLAGEDLRVVGEQALAAARELVAQGDDAMAEVDRDIDDILAIASEARAFAAAQQSVLDEAKEDLDQAESLHDAGEISDEEYAAAQQAYQEVERSYKAALDEYGATLRARLQVYADKAGKTVPEISSDNYDEILNEVNELLDEYNDIEIEIDGKTVTVREARENLAEMKTQLLESEELFNQKLAELRAAWAQYYAAVQRLETEKAAGEQRIAEGEQQLADVQSQVDEGRAQVEQRRPQLEAAKRQLSSMTEYDWTVADRAYNGGMIEASMLSSIMGRLAFSMAALFVIVGLLVCYSAVSRIVHEQVVQIGTKKALGLRTREITLSYLVYAALAVIAGCIVGIIVGCTLVEGIIGHTLSARFVTGPYPAHFGLPLALGVTALELVLVLGATWLACRSVLSENAIELLKGAKPPEAKTRFYEKWAAWDRLPLFTQTVVNNCINDRRRMFSTIVGVAGCTALIVTAITLNDDVLTSYDEQYSNVYGFDTIVYVDRSVDDAALNVAQALRNENVDSAPVRLRFASVEKPDGTRAGVRVIVPTDDESFARLYQVNTLAGQQFDNSSDGIWFSNSYATHAGGKVGQEAVLDFGDGAQRHFAIAGFYEYRLTLTEMVMNASQYESVMGSAPVANALLVDAHGASAAEVAQMLEDVPGFDAVSADAKAQKNSFDSFAGVSRTVVGIYLALAVLMAIVVLLNLNVMFITEKKRELIVLMINGFSTHDAKRYIYNDTIVLTAIGIVFGIIVGCIMGSITVAAVEPTVADFFKGIAWRAVAAGLLGSAILAFAMSAVALRRIPKFDLTDINKA